MTRRLLLIDDDEAIQVTLSALLELEGFVVSVAANEREARHLLLEGEYEAVLLDWRLERSSGAQLLEPIHEHQSGARVVVITGERSEVQGVADIHGIHEKTDDFMQLARLLSAAD